MKTFWQCFVPLFIAVDAIGVLPMFVLLTEKIGPAKRKKIVFQSVVTASIVALIFVWFGPVLLRFLGVSVPDFMIAGGLLLLALSLSDLLTGEKRQRQTDPDSVGAVPIGVPLISGPAVLTTCILLAGIHGHAITSAAIILNIVLAGIIFLGAGPITRSIGKTGTKTISRLASLLLAAIAVMLMRRGITEILSLP